MGQAQINVRTRACSRTFIARTKQVALTHNVRGKELIINFIEFFKYIFTIARCVWCRFRDNVVLSSHVFIHSLGPGSAFVLNQIFLDTATV